MARQLLTEGGVFGVAEILPESRLTESDQKVMAKYGGNKKGRIISGICQMADVKNGNGRIYPRKILEREVEKYKQAIHERRAFGSLDHPDNSVVEFQTVSHMLIDIWWEDNKVMCKTLVFDDPRIPMGHLVGGILDFGGAVGISSRALGSVHEDRMNGTTIVEDDLGLICFDIVTEPSTPGAWQTPDGYEAHTRRSQQPTDFSKRLTPMEEQELLKYLQRESKQKIEHALDEILRG